MNNTSCPGASRWLRNFSLPVALIVALTGAAQLQGIARAQGARERPAAAAPKGVRVSVDLPDGLKLFPPGDGAQIANSQCLICHSTEMVLTQPPLTLDEWTAEIGKMRNTYGAPLPAEQVGILATYLHGIDGR